MNKPLYNLDAFRDMLGDDQSEILVMVNMFIDLIPQSLNEMMEASNQQNWVETGNIAHKIKSSLKMMGMDDLSEKAHEIERKGKNNEDINLIPQLIIALNEKALAVIEVMKKDIESK